MKIYKCYECFLEKDVKDDVEIVICPNCVVEMWEVNDGRKK